MISKPKFDKEQIIRQIFLKYGYDDREVCISMEHFKNYIEKGLRVTYEDWINSNDIKTIQKYIRNLTELQRS
jgi:hypothetical protein